jgi:hypothetical protein
MKNIIHFIFILLVTISCNSKTQINEENEIKDLSFETKDEVKLKKNRTDIKEEFIDSVTGFNYEYRTEGDKKWKYYYKLEEKTGNTIRVDRDFIEYNLVLINGKIPLKIPIKELIDIIGEPDSIVEYINEIDECLSKMYYFSNMVFKRNASDSLATIESINFKNDVYILYKGIEFNENSELIFFKDLFPLSYINSIEEIDKYDLNKNDLNQNTLRFSTSEKDYTDDNFIFSFNNKKLVSLWYWKPT